MRSLLIQSLHGGECGVRSARDLKRKLTAGLHKRLRMVNLNTNLEVCPDEYYF
jgi:hypothetical protein